MMVDDERCLIHDLRVDKHGGSGIIICSIAIARPQFLFHFPKILHSGSGPKK